MKNYEMYKEKSESWIIKCALEQAFKNSKYFYKRFYSLTGGGMYHLIFDSETKNIFDFDEKRKNIIPPKSTVKDKKKQPIIQIALDHLSEMFDKVYETSVGICIIDEDLGKYELKLVKKMKEPS